MLNPRWRLRLNQFLPFLRSRQSLPGRSDRLLVGRGWLTEWEALIKAKRFEDAAAVAKERLEPIEGIYGSHSHEMSICLQLLTLSLAMAGRVSDREYRAFLIRAIELDGQIDGADHAIVAMHLEHLAVSFIAVNDYPSAEPHLRRCISIWERCLGPDAPKVAACLHRLANVRFQIGDQTEARRLLERAVTILERHAETKWRELIAALEGLAGLADRRGETAEAMHMCSRILLIQEDALGPASRELAVNRAMYALWLRDRPGADRGMLRIWYAQAIEIMAKTPEAEFRELFQRWKTVHGSMKH